MKKLTSVLLTVVLALSSFLLAACGSKGPAQALSDELKALRSGNISADDSMSAEQLEMQKALYQNLKYTIGKETVSGDTATVAVEITVTDMKTAFTNYMSEAFLHSTDEDWDEDAAFLNLITASDAPTLTQNVTVNMTKVDGAWIVDEDNNNELQDVLSGGLLSYLSDLGGLSD